MGHPQETSPRTTTSPRAGAAHGAPGNSAPTQLGSLLGAKSVRAVLLDHLVVDTQD